MPRVVFFGAKTKRALLAYLRMRKTVQPTDSLWERMDGGRLEPVGLREVVRRRARQAGVPEPQLHAFRRAFAINSLRNGCDLVTLQRLLGHSSLEVVSRYLKQVDTDLRAAHARSGLVDHGL